MYDLKFIRDNYEDFVDNLEKRVLPGMYRDYSTSMVSGGSFWNTRTQ